ncbi:hypothetical protein [Rhodococcoides corynebacterioides]|uniref:hypothetical protein n=1 Tax=Rhodococcoides corynebacterioides TaxID=53972 RepID=UPI001C9AEEF2|nr:hypothetical protein [Rhodococcus corynebacterioides]MBY6352027.1 hypothetical protein [Rhodococcus corynebacterioides]
MNERLTEDDYQLRWPRTLFVEEAAHLLSHRNTSNWDDQCEALLRDAFTDTPTCGPLDDFRELPGHLGADWGGQPVGAGFTARQNFLRQLMMDADTLNEDPPAKPARWRQRRGITPTIGGAATAPHETLVNRYINLVKDLDRLGYFDRVFTRDCVDDERSGEPEQYLHEHLDAQLRWPLDAAELVADEDLFYELIEVLHDAAARPRDNWHHTYDGCGFHGTQFHAPSGRAAYRWRVNKLLERTGTPLRLADNASELGRLVPTTDEAREEVIDSLFAHTSAPSADRIQHAISEFRRRGATREDKRSALAELAGVLEQRKMDGDLNEVIKSPDAKALFQIANRFDIRHHNETQQGNYPDYYLDWIFWTFLASIELTNKISADEADRQQQTGMPA